MTKAQRQARAKKAGTAAAKKMSPKARSARARKGARALWTLIRAGHFTEEASPDSLIGLRRDS